MKTRLLFLFLHIFVSVKAQYNNLKFENFSTAEGISSSTCTEIFQDSDGFLWFGTIDGLNRYDGHSFTSYRPILNDPNTISNNRVNAITEDGEGRLWIGTSNGLNILDKHTEKFIRINFGHINSSHVGGIDLINTLFYDEAANTLWIGTKNGLYKLLLDRITDPSFKNLSFIRYIHKTNAQESIDNNDITGILKDRDGHIWIGTAGKYLNRYVPATGKSSGTGKMEGFEKVLIDIPFSFGLDHIPKKILEDRDGNFWIGNNLSDLVLWDRKRKVFLKQEYIKDVDIPIFDLYEDKKGIIWIATDGYGIYLLDKGKDSLQHITHNPADPLSLPNNQPSKILEDKDGIFWIASYNKGVSKLALTKSVFGHYFYQQGSKNGLSTGIAQSLIQARDGKIWIGTDGGGLNVLDETTGNFQYFTHNENDPSSLSSDKIVYLIEGNDGNIWVCTWDGGLNKFNPKTKKAVQYKHTFSDPFSISQNTVWCAVQDSLDRLWVGTQTAGLNLFDPVSGKFRVYRHLPGNPHSLASDFVFYIHIDSQKRLLAGTSSGLSVLYPEDYLKDTVPLDLKFHEIGEGAIRGNRINYITEDRHGNIWLGTDLGLHRFDPDLKWQRSYSTRDGLPNNLVVGIKEDNAGNIWITTKSGLSRLNPQTQEFKNFNTHDGIQGMEFQSKSITKAQDGRILVGGINGFNIFDPEDMDSGEGVIRPMITDFKLFNRIIRNRDTVNGRVLLQNPISKTGEIRLRHNEAHIGFGFVALYYQNPERVRYAYKMEGLDQDWIYTGTNSIANYSNLEAGDYTFQVKASMDETWENAPVSEVNLQILPPPWKTWWAYLLYCLLIIAILWVSIRYYTKKVREEKEHELDQMKLRFFINVSHEFRTPLTLILNPVDKILSSYTDPEEVKTAAQTIQRSARRLLNLMNQLLDFRRMEQGKSPMEPVKGDIVKFSKDIYLLFTDLAKMKGLDFSFKSDEGEIVAWFDLDKVEKIITNLLSNAIKFTDEGGSVTLSVSRIVWERKQNGPFSFLRDRNKKSGKGVEIKVEDTGIGFKRKHLKEVFSRFFHAGHTKTGTGIGLNFTKGLVEQHGGEISMESEHKKGSVFTVKLPLDNKPSIKEKDSSLKAHVFDTDTIRSTEYEIAISGEHGKPENVHPQDGEGKKQLILIVEDNKELRFHLRNELKSGFNIKEAVNGVEGLKKAKKYFPDIIISDVMMPKMDGFEMCRGIKTDIETSHIPLILLTARSLEEDKMEGYNTGADGYLSKPFRIDVLKARIHNLLESRRKLREKFTSIVGVVPSEEIATNSLDKVFLDKVTKTIFDNVSDPDFTLDLLLKEMAVSRSHFYRKIHSLTGHNPSSFIRTVRLKYASEQLLKGNSSVKEIAYMTGFNSPAYFSKTFRELFGLTPNEFVEKARTKP